MSESGLGHLLADAGDTAPGVPVLAVSAATGEGTDALAALLAHRTTALIGQSGAGKSTLVNALLGSRVQVVNDVRDADGKGRHTTTTRDLLLLPGGGCLIDTPGVRGVGMFDSADGVAQVFGEIEDLARDCRFHDCGHVSEPGCAVLTAVDDGTLPSRRLESYRKLLRENAWIASRTDARLRAEQRRLWKKRGAESRMMTEAKRGGGVRGPRPARPPGRAEGASGSSRHSGLRPVLGPRSADRASARAVVAPAGGGSTRLPSCQKV